MEYINMDNRKLPMIALGTWAWGVGENGGNEIFGHSYGTEDLKAVFEKAIDLGFNLWDTAAVYGMGASEKILGELMRTTTREMIISTKFTPESDMTLTAMNEWVEGSNQRLDKKIIDFYWIHTPDNLETWSQAIVPLVKQGKIRYVGGLKS